MHAQGGLFSVHGLDQAEVRTCGEGSEAIREGSPCCQLVDFWLNILKTMIQVLTREQACQLSIEPTE